MVLKIELPEDVARSLEERWGDVARHVIETLAIEGYREGTISSYQVQCMLDLQSRFEVDAFLRKHRVPLPYDVEDLEQDAEALRRPRAAQSK